MRPRNALLIAVVLLAALAALSYRPASPTTEGRLRVAASFYPLGAFAKAVGGDLVEVTVAVPSGVEPHDFEPTPGDVAEVLSADLVIVNGGGLDAWAERLVPEIAPDRLILFEKVAGFRAHEEEEAHEGEEDDHGHEGLDPHAWLDPELAARLVAALGERLVTLDPAHASDYAARAADEIRRLGDLDAAFREGLSACRRKEAVVSHDAYGYLAARYGFMTHAVAGLSPDEEPSARELAALADVIRAEGLKHVFFETLVDKAYADVLARETGATALTLNPLEGLTPSQETSGIGYHEVMRENLANLRLALDCP